MSASEPLLPESRKLDSHDNPGGTGPRPRKQTKLILPAQEAPAPEGPHPPGSRLILPTRQTLVLDEEPGEEPDGLPPALTEGASPLSLMQALRRRWMQALPVGLLLAVLAGGLVWALRPEKYTAYVLLRVAPVEQKLLQDATRSDAERVAQYQKTQVTLLTSRPVIRAALKQERVHQLSLIREQHDPAEWLEKELLAELIPNTEIIRLSLSSRHHQEDLAVIVNAIQDAYLSEIVKGEHAHQFAVLEDMEKIHGASQEKLRAQREALRQLSESIKTGDSQILTIKQKNLLEEYAALKKELYGLQTRLRDAQLKLVVQRPQPEAGSKVKGAADTGPEPAAMSAAIDREVDADPLIQKQQAEVYRLEDQIAHIELRAARLDNPLRTERKQQLEVARSLLVKMRSEKRQLVAARARQVLQGDRLVRTRETEEEMKALEKQRDALKNDLAVVGREMDSIGRGSTELEMKRNEIEQAETVLKALRNEKERLQVELQSTTKQRVTLLAKAEEASVLNKKAHLLEALGASFTGLFLGLFGVSYREFRSRKLYTPAQVSHGLRLRVMGTLPALPARRLGHSALVSVPDSSDWHQLLIESVDSVRTMLLQGRPVGESSLVMVASACSGEGKTTLASHLAASLARAGRRTLLVDCDLRSPALHRLLNLARTPGVCDVLTGVATEAEAVQPTAIEGLSLLPAGGFCPAAAAALARGDLQEVFRRLRTRFDFIVVDSSPLLAVADTLMVSKGADGVLLSVRPGVSEAPQVHAACERLRQLGLPCLGAVMNGTHDRTLYAHNRRYLAQVNNE